ncbi:MAG: methyltransferase domain-containing protein [Anaerolineaceae bacterium]|nr:methyltransferase domain-containing protein [Anaerolineaceae bacterium]
MQALPDWQILWRDLVQIQNRRREIECQRLGSEDFWQDKALKFSDRVKTRWQQMDSSRELILSNVTEDETFLDIGAGTGAWSILLANQVRAVTAIEPSEAMAAELKNTIHDLNIENLQLLQGFWPQIEVDRHDHTLCSHAMYGYPDLKVFVEQMISVTNKKCFILIRAPFLDSIMGQASGMVHGHPHDSPNFHIAYNILLDMGIHANVLMEKKGLRKGWQHESLAEALLEVKERLGIDCDRYDQDLFRLLEENLIVQDKKYIWPSGNRSALIYWDV